MRNQKLHSTGRDVAVWQQFLIDQQLTPSAPDGFFGGNTRQATIAFQTQHGLTADGIVGPATRNAAESLGFKSPTEENVAGALNPNDDAIDEIANVPVFQVDGGGAIYFTAGMTIDADGAYRAYKIRNEGLDFDDNGKNPAEPNGQWIAVVTNSNGVPISQKVGDPFPGFLISTTSLQDPNRSRTDPLRNVDSERVPYIVLPGGHLCSAALGDYGIVVNTNTGKFVHVLAADSGPKRKIGEASIAVAKALLGTDEASWSPRSGGTSHKIMRYIIFPGSRDGRFPTSHPADTSLLTNALTHINSRAAGLFAALPSAHQTALLAKTNGALA